MDVISFQDIFCCLSLDMTSKRVPDGFADVPPEKRPLVMEKVRDYMVGTELTNRSMDRGNSSFSSPSPWDGIMMHDVPISDHGKFKGKAQSTRQSPFKLFNFQHFPGHD